MLSMEWILWIIVPIGIWYFASQWQKNSPQSKIEKLEGLAYEQYYSALEYAKNELKEYEEKRDKKDYIMGKKQNDDMIKFSKKTHC